MACAHERIHISPMNLPAADGHRLGGVLFEPVAPPCASVVVHGATAVRQSFYAPFARHLARRGFRVLTYDYRGVGASRPDDLRGYEASMTDWAELDAPAAVRFLRAQPGGEIQISIGHSFGGQIAALLPRDLQPAAIATVGAQLGWVGAFPVGDALRFTVACTTMIPATTRVFGYLPGWTGLGVDLPGGVAREWARWCMSPDYFLSEHPEYAERAARFAGTIYALSFSDDTFAPRAAVEGLLRLHRRARVVHQHLRPRDLRRGRVGHFGFFSSSLAADGWPVLTRFLSAVAQGTDVAAFEGFPHVARRQPGRLELTVEDVAADLRFGRD